MPPPREPMSSPATWPRSAPSAGCAAPRRPPLDPIARPLRDQRGGDHDALVSSTRQATLDAIPARSRFVAKPQRDAVAAKLAKQTVQRRRRVRNPAVLPHLAAQPARRYRDDNT